MTRVTLEAVIRLALILAAQATDDAVPLIAEDTGVLRVVATFTAATPATVITRALPVADPEAIVIDVAAAPRDMVPQLRSGHKAVIVGFAAAWTDQQREEWLAAGVSELLRAPFSASALDAAVRRALWRHRPPEHPNLLTFLPSKAGSGCSTVALNVAAALANDLGKRTLLMEGDRRSGALSILLNVETPGGLPAVIASSGNLTPMEWHQHLETIGKLDLLLANPSHPGPQPTWATFYHVLHFIRPQYEYVCVDLPELINPATSVLALASRLVFIVCEPELASLRMVALRRAELEAAGVPPDKICVLANRWEFQRLTKEALEHTASTPMYAALPNDYLEIEKAALQSRLVSKESAFGKACDALARRVSGAPQLSPDGPVATLLRRFRKSS